MNETQEINGKLYKRVPDKVGTCTGCAFYTPANYSISMSCQLHGQVVSCTHPSFVIFVEASACPETDEQCGVGNG